MLDCHTHSIYSHDGKNTPEEIVKKAIQMGLKHIAITDHSEKDLTTDQTQLFYKDINDAKKYCDILMPIKQKYADQIYVCIGIECGYMKECNPLFLELLKEKRIEYVINSIHLVNGADPYKQGYFDNKTKSYAFNEFLNSVEESLYAPYRFNAIGHLTYISRTAPYPDPILRYKDFKAPLDRILKRMIEKDIILELNTSVYNLNALSLPDTDIIEAYLGLGGKNITLASDAHSTDRLASHYPALATAVKTIGFKHWTVIQNGKLTNLPLE